MTSNVYDLLVYYCRKELPNEACGLLSGKEGLAATIWPMKNMDKSPVSFSMDIRQIEHVFNRIKKKNEEVLGIYHSHPTADAYPSKGDIALNNHPDLFHIIISFETIYPKIKAYQINENYVTSKIIQIV
ncbi:M67 family metallopeptidase [Bacillus sp. J33]|uniref:M67 family metallopeptidase n=1 Tax=Bacillus sp. J33 TaxID=935836 RepID=UPI0005538FA0|nr:M67 family metallopeptidase [Bacillus sp. J33]